MWFYIASSLLLQTISTGYSIISPIWLQKKIIDDYWRLYDLPIQKKNLRNLRENTSVMDGLATTDLETRMKFSRGEEGAYKGRENFSVRHRSVGMAARLVRGNTRNKFRNLTAIPSGARTFEFSCGARDGKCCSLFFSLFFNTFRGDLSFPLWREFRKIPSSTERERSLFSNIIKVFQSSPLPSRSWEEWGRVIRPRILMKAVFFFQSKIRKVNICIRSFIYSLYRWIRGKICLMFKIE